MDYFKESIELHKRYKGKIRVSPKMEVQTTNDLSLVYSPGVAGPSQAIADDPSQVWDLTIKGNTVAIVSDGSAVLGLGNIGAEAAIPVMEGKAMLFKKFAGIDGFPICLNTQDTEKIIDTIKIIAPVFGGINLEDISAPRSFEIESRLQDIGIPVFHDDQHGTAIVVLAGLLNACRVVGKDIKDVSVVINGSGAAGMAIAKLLKCIEVDDTKCTPIKDLIMCDSRGIIHKDREDLNASKRAALQFSNRSNRKGSLKDALVGADVFIGVSVANVLDSKDIATMAKDSIIFALANPVPEIMPEEAKKGGARVVATGRSDLPNQVNNVLGFPGIFRGALDAKASSISPGMKLAAAYAIASCVPYPTEEQIIPQSLNLEVCSRVADAVHTRAVQEGIGRDD